MALEFAKKEFNLILVSHNFEKQAKLRPELLKIFPKVDILIFIVDFSHLFKSSEFQDLANFVSKIVLSIVINNVGVNYKNSIKNLHIDSKKANKRTDIISINICSYVLSHFNFTKQMAKTKNKRSAFIDIGSINAGVRHPTLKFMAQKIL